MSLADISFIALPVLFFVIAFAYSSVGLGGGSSYTALMAIFGIHYLAIPTVSLVMNLFVTTIGSFNFIRHKHARAGLIAPFFISSIPMSYIGGSLQLPREVFLWVLLVTLVSIVARLYLFANVSFQLDLQARGKLLVSVVTGAILGLIAGIVGIGGGIYLVPLIIILGLGSHKEAAATGVLFVWVNSLSGLLARIQHNPVDILEYLPLVLAVIIGGSLGSWLGSSKFKAATMQQILGAILVVAVIILAKKLLFDQTEI